MPESSASIGWTIVSAVHITSTGLTSLPTKLRMISMQWQPMSTMAPPPAIALSQNQALCGPGVRLPGPDPQHLAEGAVRTEASDFRVFGV